jgi:Protein of unknown function (DUF3551)
MKRLAIAIAIFGGSIGIARAQSYPWCLQSGAFLGAVHCTYSTFEQCQFDRQGLGGFCSQNPDYVSPQPRSGKGHRH